VNIVPDTNLQKEQEILYINTLFYDTVICYLYIASMSDDGNTSMGQWWINTDRGKIKYSRNNFSERHLPHSGAYFDWFGIEPKLLRKEFGN